MDLTMNHLFKIAARICECFCKIYNLSSILNLPGFTTFRFFFLLKDIDEFFKLLVLSDNPILVQNTPLTAQFLAKYIEKHLQHIFKTVLKAQILILASIIFLKSFQKRFLKTHFSEIYCRKN